MLEVFVGETLKVSCRVLTRVGERDVAAVRRREAHPIITTTHTSLSHRPIPGLAKNKIQTSRNLLCEPLWCARVVGWLSAQQLNMMMILARQLGEAPATCTHFESRQCGPSMGILVYRNLGGSHRSHSRNNKVILLRVSNRTFLIFERHQAFRGAFS